MVEHSGEILLVSLVLIVYLHRMQCMVMLMLNLFKSVVFKKRYFKDLHRQQLIPKIERKKQMIFICVASSLLQKASNVREMGNVISDI